MYQKYLWGKKYLYSSKFRQQYLCFYTEYSNYMLYVLCKLHKSTYHLFSSGKNNKCEYKNAYFLLKCTHTYCCVTKAPLSSPMFDFIKCFTHSKNLLLSPPGNNTVVKGHIKRISDNDLQQVLPQIIIFVICKIGTEFSKG